MKCLNEMVDKPNINLIFHVFSLQELLYHAIAFGLYLAASITFIAAVSDRKNQRDYEVLMAAAVSEKKDNLSGMIFHFFTVFTVFLIFYYLLLEIVLHTKCYRKYYIKYLDILSALKFSTNL